MLWACFKFGLWTFKMALYGDVARRWAGLLTEDSHFFLHRTLSLHAVFYFYIFQFRFLQKYIFVFEIYRNIPSRAAGTWPPRC